MYETMFLTLDSLAKPRCRRHRNLRLPARGPEILNMILLIKMVLLIDYMIIFVQKTQTQLILCDCLYTGIQKSIFFMFTIPGIHHYMYTRVSTSTKFLKKLKSV